MTMYLFFDTETTGVPRNYKAPASDLANWPRLVQLAYLLYTKEGELVSSHQVIVRPDGFTIPEGASAIHGISTEKALAEGRPLREVLHGFATQIAKSSLLIAHNMAFDEKIAGAEFLRCQMPDMTQRVRRFCTMERTTGLMKLPGRYGQYKWPNLTELHTWLFGEGFGNAHDALADIEATAKCFWEIVRRKNQGDLG